MINVHRSHDREHADHGWMQSSHAFASGASEGFRSLRALNEIRLAPGEGFDTHRHENMEIITYVVEGVWEHNDGLNNGTVIFPGDIQRMTAGTGVAHTEFNHSRTEPVHVLQIWITPERPGLVPSYEQRMFVPEESIRAPLLLASHDGREDSVTVHQDAELFLCTLEPGAGYTHELHSGRAAWVQLVRGSIMLGEMDLHAGDGAAVTDESSIHLHGLATAEVLVLELGG